MKNPFHSDYSEASDLELIDAALEGSQPALEALLSKHQAYIYNVALKFVLSPQDAQDLTQEVLIIAFTKLSQFRKESSFRTWLYRIVFNHFLQMKRRTMEGMVTDFVAYGDSLDQIPDQNMTEQEQMEHRQFIEDANIGCMTGMLLCLSREQRLVYILGEIFGIDHTLGSELMEIGKDNYRKILSRARADLYQFMNRKCGLVNQANPCRCHRKTKGFIEAGWVNRDHPQFASDYVQRIQKVVPEKARTLRETMEGQYAALFREHPFQERESVQDLSRNLLVDPGIRELFNL